MELKKNGISPVSIPNNLFYLVKSNLELSIEFNKSYTLLGHCYEESVSEGKQLAILLHVSQQYDDILAKLEQQIKKAQKNITKIDALGIKTYAPSDFVGIEKYNAAMEKLTTPMENSASSGDFGKFFEQSLALAAQNVSASEESMNNFFSDGKMWQDFYLATNQLFLQTYEQRLY